MPATRLPRRNLAFASIDGCLHRGHWLLNWFVVPREPSEASEVST